MYTTIIYIFTIVLNPLFYSDSPVKHEIYVSLLQASLYVTAESVQIVLHCARRRPGHYPQHSTTIQK